MFKSELIDGPSLKTVKHYPPQIVIEEGPDNSAVINLWRSRVLSSNYAGDFTKFLTDKIAGLFNQGFDKVQIDRGRPSRPFFGYRPRISQADKDASFFSSPKTLSQLSSLTSKTINATQGLDTVRDYDGTGQHIFITLEAEKR